MFHSVPGDVSSYRTDDSPLQPDISTPANYDFSRCLLGEMDPRQLSNSVPPPVISHNSGSVEILYNPTDASTLQRHNLGWVQQLPAQLDLTPPEFGPMDVAALEHVSEAAFSATDTRQQYLAMPLSIAATPTEPSQAQLPSQERVLNMVDSFFSAQHQLLPSVHRDSFMVRLSNDMIGLSSGPFLWVILALYCSCNKSDSMQVQYRSWMHTAHSKLELMSTTRVRSNTTNMLQASIWMIFDAYCRGDVTNAWLLLGRAAQLTSALGLDRMDSTRQTPRMESELRSHTDIEVEERRKCMWCLALLDRIIVSVNGLALSMDDRYFHVDFPLPDDEFQEARNSIGDIEYLRESYSSEAFDLLNGNATSAMAAKPSFEHVLKASVVLGRALAIQNAIRPDDDSTHKQNLDKLRTLESVLNAFCYAASASGEGIGPMSLMQLWLKMLTQCAKILMLHPPGPSTLGLCDCLSPSAPSISSIRPDTECVRAAMNAANTFSHALNETLLALNNPFLLPVACMSVRMLTLLRDQMHESHNERAQRLMGEILRVVDYVGVKFPGAAAKARETIMRRVNEHEHGTRRSSLESYVGLDCE